MGGFIILFYILLYLKFFFLQSPDIVYLLLQEYYRAFKC